MTAHLPVLHVILPLLAAPSCLLIRRPNLIWVLSLGVSAVSFLVSIALLQQVLATGPVSYALGGWEAPWGIEYRIDELNAILLLIITAVSTVVLVAAQTSIEKEIPRDRQMFFYILYLLSLTGMLGIVSTGDAFNVFVFLEISSLSGYALIAMGKGRRAVWSSFQYLVMGTIGATFILISIGLIYGMTGTLNMADIASRLPAVAHTKTIFAAFVFFVVGVSLKLALFPIHHWLPNAYSCAPSIVTAFFAATSTKVALYLLIRFTFSVFGFSFSFTALPMNELFLVIGILGIFFGSIAAIYQENIKHLFAFSSIAQIGYMIVGYSMGTAAGLMASLLHLFNHALMKGALFMVLAAVMYRIASVHINDFKGLGRQMPVTMAALVIGGLSLIGVPLTVGFISKWYLVLAALENGWWPVAVLVVLASLLAIVYVWRIVEAAYFAEPESAGAPAAEAPAPLLVSTWLLVAANVYFGIDTGLPVSLAEIAADSLMGTAP